VQQIVSDSHKLAVKHDADANAPVNYTCIFTHNLDEYEELVGTAIQLGTMALDTAMSPVIRLDRPIDTVAGQLDLIKIRKPDPKRTERGDADFTLPNYKSFKNRQLGKDGWSLISRPEMEMLELIDSDFDVLAYFSHPTLADVIEQQS